MTHFVYELIRRFAPIKKSVIVQSEFAGFRDLQWQESFDFEIFDFLFFYSERHAPSHPKNPVNEFAPWQVLRVGPIVGHTAARHSCENEARLIQRFIIQIQGLNGWSTTCNCDETCAETKVP